MEDTMGYKNESVMDSQYFYASDLPGNLPLNELMAEFADIPVDDLSPLIRHLMCTCIGLGSLQECSFMYHEAGEGDMKRVCDFKDSVGDLFSGACLEMYCRSHPCQDSGRHDIDDESMSCKKCQMKFRKAFLDSIIAHHLELKKWVNQFVDDAIKFVHFCSNQNMLARQTFN